MPYKYKNTHMLLGIYLKLLENEKNKEKGMKLSKKKYICSGKIIAE
jgi:hypothetical protein